MSSKFVNRARTQTSDESNEGRNNSDDTVATNGAGGEGQEREGACTAGGSLRQAGDFQLLAPESLARYLREQVSPQLMQRDDG